MKNELFNYKISSSFSKSWISTLKNVEIQQKRALSHNYGNLYHYGANNPVKYTDPDGRELYVKGDVTYQKRVMQDIQNKDRT